MHRMRRLMRQTSRYGNHAEFSDAAEAQLMCVSMLMPSSGSLWTYLAALMGMSCRA